MKKVIFLLIAIIGLSILNSCETDREDPVINTDQVTPPAITNPATGTSYILLKDSADADLATFTWTGADYGIDNLPDVTYTFQMDIADSNYLNVLSLQRSTELEFTITVGKMNDKLSGMGLLPDVAGNVAFRVLASQSANMEDIFSNSLTLSFTPYSTVVTGDALFLYGGSTEAGWDNSAAIAMTLVEEDYYASVETLDPSGDGMIFITTLGQDIPNWGTDANGTNEAGLLVIQATENDPATVTIPSPLEAGDYRIEAHTGDSSHYVIINYPDDLFLLGDATIPGWDNANALPLTKEAPGIFSITTTLAGDGTFFKFIGVLTQWAPMFGTDADGTGLEGNLSWRPTEDVSDPPAMPSPDAGTYLIEVNLITLRYTCTAQ